MATNHVSAAISARLFVSSFQHSRSPPSLTFTNVSAVGGFWWCWRDVIGAVTATTVVSLLVILSGCLCLYARLVRPRPRHLRRTISATCRRQTHWNFWKLYTFLPQTSLNFPILSLLFAMLIQSIELTLNYFQRIILLFLDSLHVFHHKLSYWISKLDILLRFDNELNYSLNEFHNRKCNKNWLHWSLLYSTNAGAKFWKKNSRHLCLTFNCPLLS